MDVEGAIWASDHQNLLKFRRAFFFLTAAKSSNAADRRVVIITPRSLVYRLLVLFRENEGLQGHGERVSRTLLRNRTTSVVE
jgi:hypothetical protein